MTGIKYDTRSLCHHCREGHFPLEWNGGWCRADFFLFLFSRQTGLLRCLSHITSTGSHLHLHSRTTTNCCFSSCIHAAGWSLSSGWSLLFCVVKHSFNDSVATQSYIWNAHQQAFVLVMLPNLYRLCHQFQNPWKTERFVAKANGFGESKWCSGQNVFRICKLVMIHFISHDTLLSST